MKRFYTGVGSRETPLDIQRQMIGFASVLESWDFILRSGHAKGADIAFERGVLNDCNKKIYSAGTKMEVDDDTWKKSVAIAIAHHPNPGAAMKYIALIGRNPFQVLGDDLKTKSDFVICWTANGKDVGGTGTTMRIATAYIIPIYNMFSIPSKEILAAIKRKYMICDCGHAKEEHWVHYDGSYYCRGSPYCGCGGFRGD